MMRMAHGHLGQIANLLGSEELDQAEDVQRDQGNENRNEAAISGATIHLLVVGSDDDTIPTQLLHLTRRFPGLAD